MSGYNHRVLLIFYSDHLQSCGKSYDLVQSWLSHKVHGPLLLAKNVAILYVMSVFERIHTFSFRFSYLTSFQKGVIGSSRNWPLVGKKDPNALTIPKTTNLIWSLPVKSSAMLQLSDLGGSQPMELIFRWAVAGLLLFWFWLAEPWAIREQTIAAPITA